MPTGEMKNLSTGQTNVSIYKISLIFEFTFQNLATKQGTYFQKGDVLAGPLLRESWEGISTDGQTQQTG